MYPPPSVVLGWCEVKLVESESAAAMTAMIFHTETTIMRLELVQESDKKCFISFIRVGWGGGRGGN